MNTTVRSILSSFGLGLAALTVVSALFIGPAASLTVFAFSLLAVYGLVEIAILSYAPAPFVRVRPVPVPVAVERAAFVRARVPAMVEYSTATARRAA